MRLKPEVLKNGRETLIDKYVDRLDIDQFSYFYIEDGEDVLIPENQEMILRRDIMVAGDLMVHGDLVQLADASEQGFFWTTIPATSSVRVPVNRLMLYASPLIVRGELMVSGILKEVS
jgi:hypothetical protein